MSINQFIIDGNVTKDVELRRTGGGTPTATYAVAVNEVYYDGEQKRERTDFIPVTTYGRQAENDAKYLKKGSGVTVMGVIRSWYKPGVNGQDGRGGFNFEAERVIYRGKPAGAAGQAPAAQGDGGGEVDPWLRDYDRAAGA